MLSSPSCIFARNTPMTVKLTPLMRILWPSGYKPGIQLGLGFRTNDRYVIPFLQVFVGVKAAVIKIEFLYVSIQRDTIQPPSRYSCEHRFVP